MLIYYLALIFSLMYIVTYYLSGKDIICPAFIYLSGYVASVLCAIYNVDRWTIDLHWDTLFVLIYGTLLFLVTSYFIHKYMNKKYECTDTKGTEHDECVTYNRRNVMLFCFVQTALLALFVWYIMCYLPGTENVHKLSEGVELFKQLNFLSVQQIRGKFLYTVNHYLYVITMSQYVMIYILVKNYVITKSLTRDLWVLCSLILSTLQLLISGSRGPLIISVAAIFVMFIFFEKQCRKHIVSINAINILKLCSLLVVGAFIFYFVRVGKEPLGIIDYITMYLGGPIQLLDMFLQNPLPPSDIFGKETFYAIISDAIRFGFIKAEPYLIHLEFRVTSTGATLGNIYTSYRSYLYDFGYIGLTLLPIIFALCSNYIYYSFVYKCRFFKINPYGMAYIFILQTLIFDFARGHFFASLPSCTNIKCIIILLVLCYFFVYWPKDGSNKNPDIL